MRENFTDFMKISKILEISEISLGVGSKGQPL